MANGDLAAAAGLAVFSATMDRRQGYDNDNIRGDELAGHVMTTVGAHPISAITGLQTALNDRYTKSVIDSAFSSQNGIDARQDGDIAAALAAANAAAAAVGGKRDWGDGNFGGNPIYTPHGRSNPVSSSYVAAYINADGRIGASPSSRRYKTNVTPLSVEVPDILAIEPVEFDRIEGDHEVGLIAEQVEEHVPQIVVRTGDQIDGVHYHLLPVLLLRVVQEQQARIAALEAALTPPQED